MQNTLIAAVIVIILGAGYYAFSQKTGTPEDIATPPQVVVESPAPAPVAAPATTTTATPAVKEFTITNKGFAYSEKVITVQKGDRVKITYTNGGGTHDLRIDGYNVGTAVIKGDTSESFEFVADKAGDFEFFCSVGNHRAMGMKGTFTVTE